MATEPKPPTDEVGYAGTTPPPWHTLQAGITDEIPDLLWPNSVKVYHTMRTDSQIDGLSKAVTLPIRRRKWGIDPNGAREEVVVKVASDLGLPILGTDENPGRGRRARFNHDEHLRHALLGLWYGGMFFEQVGEPDADLDWRLKKLAPRMPQSIVQIKVAADGGLSSIVQYGIPGRTPVQKGQSWVGAAMGTEIDVSRLVAYVWDREGANWAGRSMYRPLYRHWLIKDRLIRVDAMKNERFGLGIPYGRAPKGANEKTVAQYGALAQTTRAGAQSGVGLPSGGEVGVEGIKGTLPDIIASLRYHDEAMARNFLAMFLQLGQTETGSRALGEEFVDFFELSVDAVCTWYASTTNEHVIEDIVDWNWGVDENAPVIGWEDDSDEEAPLAAADLVQLIQQGLVVVDDNLRSWARDHWSLPEEGGTVYPLPTPAAPVPVPAAASLPRPRTGRTPRDVRASGTRSWIRVVHGQRERITIRTPVAVAAKAGDSRSRVAARSQTLTRPNAAHRDMTPQEVAAATDFDAIQQTWADGTTDLVASWSDVKAQQVDELVAAVEAAAIAGNIEALATITAPVLGAALIGDAMVRMAEDAINQARAEATAQGVTIELVNVAEIEPLIRARAEATAALMARAISEAAARQGIQRYGVDALTPEAVAAGVRDHLESLSDVYLEDMLGGALTQAQNTGRRAVFGRGPSAKYYASELLDTNTCEACDQKDKTEYATLDEAQLDYPTGGYAECLGGARCRGTLVAVYDTEEEATIE